MRRFPQLRGLRPNTPVPGPDRGHLRRRDDVIEGAFVWPHDPAFRPLIGIYADGRLQQLATTYRRPLHDHRRWPCCFRIALNEELADRQDVTVAVFETGALLAPPPPADGSILTVEDLIDSGRRRTRPFAYGGFLSFLLLPLTDQIRIIWRDLRDCDAPAAEVEAYRQQVIAGELSILGVRDDIALSEEAQETYAELTLHERRGRACLWQGLDLAFDSIIPPPLARDDFAFATPLALRCAFEEIASPSDVRSILALNAVGETTDIAAYAQWVADHPDIIAAVEPRVSRSIAHRAQPRHRRYRLGNLLAAMKPGKTALRLPGGAVSAKAGVAGVVVYGPYMAIGPGRHTAHFSLQNETPGADPLRLRLEIVYGDVLFAGRDVVLPAAATDTLDLAFTVPCGQQTLLQPAKFEFRLSTNGAADVVCGSVVLDVGEDSTTETRTLPAVENWLALLTPEAAGERAGGETMRALAPSGRVFFGPYRKLLPGRYALTLIYGPASDAAAPDVELEVVAGPDKVLAQRRFRLTAGGGRESLPFEIGEAETAGDLTGPLEFRLWKAVGFEFFCLALELNVVGEPDAGS